MKRIIAILMCGIMAAMTLCSCQLSELFGTAEETTTAGSADVTTAAPTETTAPK